MKEKSNYKVVDVLSEDFDKNDRIEWLKQLYAAWLEKRRVILNYNNIETYLINESDELDTECYW